MKTDQRKLFFLLARLDDTEVLLEGSPEGYALPCYDTTVAQNVGFEEPAAYNAWFRERYGIQVIRRYPLDHENTEDVIFVLETREENIHAPDGTAWLRADDLSSMTLRREEDSRFLTAWFAARSASVTMPWAQAGGHDAALAWMHQQLSAQGLQCQGDIAQLKNAYVSSVFRCPTQQGNVFLKIVPTCFIREPQLMATLAMWGITELPEMLAVDTARGYLLMRDMGGVDLSAAMTLEDLETVVRQYAEFQCASTELIDVDNTSPFYDLRLGVLSAQIEGLAEDISAVLLNSPYSFSEEECERLRARTPYWKQRCAELNALGLPDAVDHADLRPGNIRVLPDRMLFYDWAWSSVSHPFFSIVSLMHILTSPLNVLPGGEEKLRASYLEAWRPYAAHKTLCRAYALADQLSVLYATVLDVMWLRSLLDALPDLELDASQPDAWTLRWRQYYCAKMARRLL